MTRDEYLEQAKQRALKYWEHGDLLEAVTSMMSDLHNHEELRHHQGLYIGEMWLVSPALHQDRNFVHRFIVGFR